MGLLIESVKATFSVLKKCPQVLIFTIILYGFSQLLSFHGLGTFPLTIFNYLLYAFIALLYTASFQLIVKDALLSKHVSLTECLSRGLKKLHKVLGLMILFGLMGLVFAIPMILMIFLKSWILLPLSLIGIAAVVISIYVFIRLTFSMPIIMIENSGIIESMKKSWKASKNKFWSIIGAFSLLGLLFIPYMMAMFAFSIISLMQQIGGLSYLPTAFSSVQDIVLIALGIVPSTLISFLPAAYYLKTRKKKEEG
jgi:membrane-anchored glycerophosphoryl diester phosphodiesterase (GDPDase)